MDKEFQKAYSGIINEQNKPVVKPMTALEHFVVNYITEILQLNFGGYEVTTQISTNSTKFIINCVKGIIGIEIENDNPDYMLIYLRVTDSKILGKLELSSNNDVYSYELPFNWSVLDSDEWINKIHKCYEILTKLAADAGIKM